MLRNICIIATQLIKLGLAIKTECSTLLACAMEGARNNFFEGGQVEKIHFSQHRIKSLDSCTKWRAPCSATFALLQRS